MALAVLGLALIVAVVLGRLLGSNPPPEPRAPKVSRTCDRVASPPGANRPAATLHSVQALFEALAPGQTGCLRGGTYTEDVTVRARNVTLRSSPGERARLVGRLWFTPPARGDVVSGLVLDGRNARRLPSPTVNADHITFTHVEVTNDHTGICFVIGSHRYGPARGTIIRDSRIHDCGRLPPHNRDHGIYVAAAQDTWILDDLIYANADRGIQLYPDAQHTTIRGNVIDRNGEGIIFSGAGGVASSGNVVEHNVVSNSRIRADVESFYSSGGRVGTGNVVRDNCIGRIDTSGGGFTASSNVMVEPRYADPQAGDFTLDPGDPCLKLLRDR